MNSSSNNTPSTSEFNPLFPYHPPSSAQTDSHFNYSNPNFAPASINPVTTSVHHPFISASYPAASAGVPWNPTNSINGSAHPAMQGFSGLALQSHSTESAHQTTGNVSIMEENPYQYPVRLYQHGNSSVNGYHHPPPPPQPIAIMPYAFSNVNRMPIVNPNANLEPRIGMDFSLPQNSAQGMHSNFYTSHSQQRPATTFYSSQLPGFFTSLPEETLSHVHNDQAQARQPADNYNSIANESTADFRPVATVTTTTITSLPPRMQERTGSTESTPLAGTEGREGVAELTSYTYGDGSESVNLTDDAIENMVLDYYEEMKQTQPHTSSETKKQITFTTPPSKNTSSGEEAEMHQPVTSASYRDSNNEGQNSTSPDILEIVTVCNTNGVFGQRRVIGAEQIDDLASNGVEMGAYSWPEVQNFFQAVVQTLQVQAVFNKEYISNQAVETTHALVPENLPFTGNIHHFPPSQQQYPSSQSYSSQQLHPSQYLAHPLFHNGQSPPSQSFPIQNFTLTQSFPMQHFVPTQTFPNQQYALSHPYPNQNFDRSKSFPNQQFGSTQHFPIQQLPQSQQIPPTNQPLHLQSTDTFQNDSFPPTQYIQPLPPVPEPGITVPPRVRTPPNQLTPPMSPYEGPPVSPFLNWEDIQLLEKDFAEDPDVRMIAMHMDDIISDDLDEQLSIFAANCVDGISDNNNVQATYDGASVKRTPNNDVRHAKPSQHVHDDFATQIPSFASLNPDIPSPSMLDTSFSPIPDISASPVLDFSDPPVPNISDSVQPVSVVNVRPISNFSIQHILNLSEESISDVSVQPNPEIDSVQPTPSCPISDSIPKSPEIDSFHSMPNSPASDSIRQDPEIDLVQPTSHNRFNNTIPQNPETYPTQGTPPNTLITPIPDAPSSDNSSTQTVTKNSAQSASEDNPSQTASDNDEIIYEGSVTRLATNDNFVQPLSDNSSVQVTPRSTSPKPHSSNNPPPPTHYENSTQSTSDHVFLRPKPKPRRLVQRAPRDNVVQPKPRVNPFPRFMNHIQRQPKNFVWPPPYYLIPIERVSGIEHESSRSSLQVSDSSVYPSTSRSSIQSNPMHRTELPPLKATFPRPPSPVSHNYIPSQQVEQQQLVPSTYDYDDDELQAVSDDEESAEAFGSISAEDVDSQLTGCNSSSLKMAIRACEKINFSVNKHLARKEDRPPVIRRPDEEIDSDVRILLEGPNLCDLLSYDICDEDAVPDYRQRWSEGEEKDDSLAKRLNMQLRRSLLKYAKRFREKEQSLQEQLRELYLQRIRGFRQHRMEVPQNTKQLRNLLKGLPVYIIHKYRHMGVLNGGTVLETRYPIFPLPSPSALGIKCEEPSPENGNQHNCCCTCNGNGGSNSDSNTLLNETPSPAEPGPSQSTASESVSSAILGDEGAACEKDECPSPAKTSKSNEDPAACKTDEFPSPAKIAKSNEDAAAPSPARIAKSNEDAAAPSPAKIAKLDEDVDGTVKVKGEGKKRGKKDSSNQERRRSQRRR